MVNNSIGVTTALNPYIGYENASRIAKQALADNCSVIDIIKKEGLLELNQLEKILDPNNMIS